MHTTAHPDKQSKITNKTKGNYGEDTARLYLVKKGYTLVAQNWRAGKQGEVDLICLSPCQKYLIFTEVKARKNSQYGSSLDAITEKKQTQLLTLAQIFLASHTEYQHHFIRFDVVTLALKKDGFASQITHLENAFSG